MAHLDTFAHLADTCVTVTKKAAAVLQGLHKAYSLRHNAWEQVLEGKPPTRQEVTNCCIRMNPKLNPISAESRTVGDSRHEDHLNPNSHNKKYLLLISGRASVPALRRGTSATAPNPEKPKPQPPYPRLLLGGRRATSELRAQVSRRSTSVTQTQIHTQYALGSWFEFHKSHAPVLSPIMCRIYLPIVVPATENLPAPLESLRRSPEPRRSSVRG